MLFRGMQVAELVEKPAYEVFGDNPVAYTRDIIAGVLAAHGQGWKQTARLARTLAGKSRMQQLQAVYRLTDERVNYVPDREGLEVAQTAAVAWDRREGDCKSYSVVIASLLKNLGIPFRFRFAQYSKEAADVHHVYVIADSGEGYYVPMDPCMRRFGVERRPWLQTKDFDPQ